MKVDSVYIYGRLPMYGEEEGGDKERERSEERRGE